MARGLLRSRRLRDPGYGRSCPIARKHFYPTYWNRITNRQVKLSSDVGTTAKPQSPLRLASDQTLDHFKEGSDQHQTTPDSEFDIQENLSSDIVTTAKPHSSSRLSIDKQKQSLHKRKASPNKKKKKKKKRAKPYSPPK